MSLKGTIDGIGDLRRNMKHWYMVPLFKYGIVKRATFTTKRGVSAEIKDKQDYYNFFSGRLWGLQKLEPISDRVTVTDNMIVLDGKIKFAYHSEAALGASLLMLGEVYGGEYDGLDVKGKTVIDVGANIADSAIYFALMGAKEVIAFEPFPATYRQAKENIELNGMSDRIRLFNAGIGGKSEIIRLPDVFIGTSGMDSIEKSAMDRNEHAGIEVRVFTLGDIAARYTDMDMVIKMDCEGCEYASILGASDDTLRHFSEFILEYHGNHTKLIERFRKAGFEPTLRLKAGRILFAKRIQ